MSEIKKCIACGTTISNTWQEIFYPPFLQKHKRRGWMCEKCWKVVEEGK